MSDESPPEDDDESITDHPRQRKSGCLVGCLIATPIIYALSPPFVIIPLLLLEQLGWDQAVNRMGSVLEALYLPLQWLYDRFEFVQTFYDWYSGLFDRWIG